MFCHNCGTELEDNALFCSNCGVKQESVVPVTPIQPIKSKNSVLNCLKTKL